MMVGHVDGLGRAVMGLTLRHPDSGKSVFCEAWIDTGFTSDVLLPRSMIAALGFAPDAATLVRSDLADGSQVVVESYIALLDWFGQELPVELLASDGVLPLLGVGVLRDHKLEIDYPKRTVVIS